MREVSAFVGTSLLGQTQHEMSRLDSEWMLHLATDPLDPVV